MEEYLLRDSEEYWQNREWDRYTHGDYISSLTDEKAPNTLLSWLEENAETMSVHDSEKYIVSVQKVLASMDEESVEKLDDKWHAQKNKVRDIVTICQRLLYYRWTTSIFHFCGENAHKNDYVFTSDYGTLAFWRLSTERKNKIIFLPGVQIEVAPFLQAICVTKEFTENMNKVTDVLRTYHAGSLYERLAEEVPEEDLFTEQIDIPMIQISFCYFVYFWPTIDNNDNIDKLVKQSKKKQKKKKATLRPLLPSRSPSLKRDERIKMNLYTEVSPIWKKGKPTESAAEVSSGHCVDFNTEAFLGPVYRLVAYKTGKKPKQCGSWMMRTETDLEEHTLSGETLQVALKVPVEEVFIGPSEPVIAFCEDDTEEWKKGVYSTHTQFDQNTFVVNARLSKLGRVALFQQSDFHFPYRRWNIFFEEDIVSLQLHTNSVEIKFVIEGHLIYLETQAGDEFSKLRALHQKRLTLAGMARQLERHGVYIFPSADHLKKQRSTRKSFELEIYCYRLICLEQLACTSCRLNGSVPSDTVIMTCQGTTLQVSENPGGGFHTSYGAEPDDKQKPHKGRTSPSSLFRWLMLTRPLPMTK